MFSGANASTIRYKSQFKLEDQLWESAFLYGAILSPSTPDNDKHQKMLMWYDAS